MSPADEQEGAQAPLLDLTAQDAGLDRQLRENLKTLRDRSGNAELASLLDDVLAGRRSLREVARTPEWNAAVAPAAQQMMQQWARLTPDERDALVAEGHEQLEASRARAYAERQQRDDR